MNRNINIQFLRVICAIIVYAGHSLGMMHNYVFDGLKDTPLHFFFDGQSAVFVFFAISGFFYYKSDKHQSMGDFGSYYLNHLGKKIIKIVPPHILLLIIAFVLCNYIDASYNHSLYTDWANSFWQEKCSLEEFVKQALIILPRDANVLNPPSWYLTVEVKMFIVMPLIVWILNKTSWKLFALLLFVPLFLHIPIIDTIMFYLLPALSHKHIERINNVVSCFWNKMLVLIIGIVLINVRNEIHLEEETLMEFDSVISFIQAIGATMIMVIIFLMPQSVAVACKERKPLLLLSEYTYEFYLTHFVILLALRPIVSSLFQMIILSLAISAITTILIKKTCSLLTAKMTIVRK